MTAGSLPQPIAPGLLSLDEGIRLIGSRCQACGNIDFPSRSSCANCRSSDVRQTNLPTSGELWTWTSQPFPPVSPPYDIAGDYEPFFVGCVDLEGTCVEGRLRYPSGTPRIGDRLAVAPLPLTLGSGETVTSYCFVPLERAR